MALAVAMTVARGKVAKRIATQESHTRKSLNRVRLQPRCEPRIGGRGRRPVPPSATARVVSHSRHDA